MPEVIVRTLNVDVKLKSEADVGLQEDVDPGISAGAMHDWEGRNLIENRNVWCKRSPADSPWRVLRMLRSLTSGISP